MGNCGSVNAVLPTGRTKKFDPAARRGSRDSDPGDEDYESDGEQYSGRSDNPNALFNTLTASPQSSMRRLSFAMELTSLKEKKGSSRIFKKMSDVRQIGDIERVHRENRSVRERKRSVDFEKIKYGRRGSLDYDANAEYHELRTILETAIGQKHLCQFMTGDYQVSACFNYVVNNNRARISC